MKLCHLLLLLVLLPGWGPLPLLYAQITLNAENFQALIGKAYVSTIYDVNFGSTQEEQAQTRLALQTLLTQRGPNQTWDFRSVNYLEPTVSSVYYLPYDQNLPGAAQFTQADHALRWGAIHIYGSFQQNNGNYYYGLAIEDSILSLPEPFLSLKFPLTYEVSWQWPAAPFTDLEVLVRFLAAFTGDSMVVRTYEQNRELLRNATVQIFWEVDSYGTLITPAGSDEALRLKRTVRVSGISGFSQPLDVYISYLWIAGHWLLSNPVEIIQAEIATTLSVSSGFPPIITQVPTRAYYSVATLRPVAVAREPLPGTQAVVLQGPYPNPATEQIMLWLTLPTTQPVTVRVYNLLGQEVARPFDGLLPSGTHRLSIAAHSWPAGLYLCRIKVGSQDEVRRFAVVH